MAEAISPERIAELEQRIETLELMLENKMDFMNWRNFY